MRVWILIFTLLSSCTLHPPYCRPAEEIPCLWRIPTDLEAQDLCWWQELQDPELNQLICLALENNQDIKTAIHRVDVFLAQLQIVNSEFYPQINGQAAGEREKISTATPFIPGINPINNLFSLILNASYFADVWGKVRSASEAAQAEVCAQVEARRAIVLGVISSVSISYIRLRQYDRQLVIAKETLDSRVQARYLAQIRYDLGLTSYLQVDQAESEVQDAETTIKQLEISIALEEDLISILIGEPPTAIPRGKLLSEIIMPPKVPTFLPSELLNQRPDILEKEQQLIAANARIGVAKSLFFPQFNLAGFYGSEGIKITDLFTSGASIWQYGLSILQEIFTGGRLTGQLKRAWAEKETLVHDYQQTILNAFKEVNDALISHQINLELIQVQKEKVETLTDYLRLSTLRYNEGETDYLTVLDAQRRLFEAELNYTQFIGDSFVSLISIYQSLGGNWVVNADSFAKENECGQ